MARTFIRQFIGNHSVFLLRHFFFFFKLRWWELVWMCNPDFFSVKVLPICQPPRYKSLSYFSVSCFADWVAVPSLTFSFFIKTFNLAMSGNVRKKKIPWASLSLLQVHCYFWAFVPAVPFPKISSLLNSSLTYQYPTNIWMVIMVMVIYEMPNHVLCFHTRICDVPLYPFESKEDLVGKMGIWK